MKRKKHWNTPHLTTVSNRDCQATSMRYGCIVSDHWDSQHLIILLLPLTVWWEIGLWHFCVTDDLSFVFVVGGALASPDVILSEWVWQGLSRTLVNTWLGLCRLWRDVAGRGRYSCAWKLGVFFQVDKSIALMQLWLMEGIQIAV